jgi:hypothetical protein
MIAANGQPVVNESKARALPQADTPPSAEPQVEAAPRNRGGAGRTPEGSEISRRNALEYGLWAKKVFPKSLQADIDQCTAEITAQFQPRSPYELRLAREMGRATAQYEHAELHILVEQQRLMDRARTSWAEDRRKAIEEQLVKRLTHDCERLIGLLKESRQGTEWVLQRWSRLGEALETGVGWDEILRSQAYDLLGVPPMFRESTRELPPADDLAGLKAVVAREQAALRQSLEDHLIASDEADRAMAAAGMGRGEDAELKRLRRAAAAAARTRDKARAELIRVQNGAPAAGGFAPKPAAAPTPTPASTDNTVRRPFQGPPRTVNPYVTGKPVEPPAAKITPAATPPTPTEPIAPPPTAAAPVVETPPKPMRNPLDEANEERRTAKQRRLERLQLLEQRKRERQARKANRRRAK